MSNEDAQAYFHAPSTSTLFGELREEDRGPEDELMRGELFRADEGQKIRRQKLAKMLCRLTVQLRILGGSWKHRGVPVYQRDIVVLVNRRRLHLNC